MVSKDVTIRVNMDDSDVVDKLAKNQAAIDEQSAEWRSKRNQILLEMHAINQGIGLMIQSIRMAVRVTGQALTPVQNALLSMISSTTSIIIATATALAAGSLGLLTGAALVLAAAAYGFQLALTARIIEQSEEMKVSFAAIDARLRSIETIPQTMRGVSF